MLSVEEAYRDHARAVYRYLLSLTHDPGLSEELTQETFYQAVKGAEKFDGRSGVLTWLCAIAKNQLLVYRRKHPPTEEIPESAAGAEDPERAAVAAAGRVELLRGLHLMEEPMREVLYLRLFGDVSFREIGEILGRTENWARVTFYRGKEKLKKEMETDG